MNDANLARFASRVPIEYDATFELYGYCDGNPLIEVDPSGMNPYMSCVLTCVAWEMHEHGVIVGLLPKTWIYCAMACMRDSCGFYPVRSTKPRGSVKGTGGTKGGGGGGTKGGSAGG
jgi:hypothetical protein